MAASKKPAKKPVSGKQAAAVANFLKAKGASAPAKKPVANAAPMVADTDDDEE